MANNPKKVKDPTEVALSAIQEALNISDAPPADNTRGSVRSDVPSSPPSYDDSFDARSADRPIFESIEIVGQTASPWSMPYERGLDVSIGRKPKVDLRQIWPELRHYI